MIKMIINAYHDVVNKNKNLHNALIGFEINETSLLSRIHDLEETLEKLI